MGDGMPRAVFFDFGGTLFSYREVQGRPFWGILLQAIERLGVEVDPIEAGRAYQVASREAFADFHARPYYLHRELFQDTFRRFALAIGGEPDRDFLDWFHARQRDLVRDAFELREGCVETLEALRARGAHVAIVSNIDDDYLHPMLERCGLDSSLDAWTSSEEARSCKPHSGIFHYSMRKAGVSAPESLFVGDSPEHDILGARRLGMRTVLIVDPAAPPPGSGAGEAGEPHHRIEALPELLEILAG